MPIEPRGSPLSDKELFDLLNESVPKAAFCCPGEGKVYINPHPVSGYLGFFRVAKDKAEEDYFAKNPKALEKRLADINSGKVQMYKDESVKTLAQALEKTKSGPFMAVGNPYMSTDSQMAFSRTTGKPLLASNPQAQEAFSASKKALANKPQLNKLANNMFGAQYSK